MQFERSNSSKSDRSDKSTKKIIDVNSTVKAWKQREKTMTRQENLVNILKVKPGTTDGNIKELNDDDSGDEGDSFTR